MPRFIIRSLVLTLGMCAALPALATPPECVGPPDGAGPPDGGGPPDNAGPPDHAGPPDGFPPQKAIILHCGCNEAGDAMVYQMIQVSTRSRGHLRHVLGSIDSCETGVDTFTDFVRNGSDCQIEGPSLGDEIKGCTTQLEFDVCGSASLDES